MAEELLTEVGVPEASIDVVNDAVRETGVDAPDEGIDGGGDAAADRSAEAAGDGSVPADARPDGDADAGSVVTCGPGQECVPPLGFGTGPYWIALDAAYAPSCAAGPVQNVVVYDEATSSLSCGSCTCSTPGVDCFVGVTTYSLASCNASAYEQSLDVDGGCATAGAFEGWSVTSPKANHTSGSCFTGYTGTTAGTKNASLCYQPLAASDGGCVYGTCQDQPTSPYAAGTFCVTVYAGAACPASFPNAYSFLPTGTPLCTRGSCSCEGGLTGSCGDYRVTSYGSSCSSFSGSATVSGVCVSANGTSFRAGFEGGTPFTCPASGAPGMSAISGLCCTSAVF